MGALGRLLQIVGLTILPLALVAQLAGSISSGQELQFLVAGACVFGVGYVLQHYVGRGGA